MAQVPTYSVMATAFINMEWLRFDLAQPAETGVYLALLEDSQGMYLLWNSDYKRWERIEPPCAGDDALVINNVSHFVPAVCRMTNTGGYTYAA